MYQLQSKKILLGVTGSIAAYKSCMLVRLLVKAGAEVRVIMTGSATEFVTPLTFSTLSKNPVLTRFVDHPETGVWNNHIELALWADALVIAPATANTISACANGFCDNLLQAIYLSMRSPVFIAPAMDLDMLHHPATIENIGKLRSHGHQILEPAYGELASGLVGNGRMAEPEEIVSKLNAFFSRSPLAAKKKVLITAGPTQEEIDPVRFISNHSTGTMGYALGETFHNAGSEVTIISGPVHISPPQGVHRICVTSAAEMYEATVAEYERYDLIIFAAAVADYTPVVRSDDKIKKKGDTLTLNLKKTLDIAGFLGERKLPHQLFLGFALETSNEIENAKAKLQKKNFDFVVLNTLNDIGAGFGLETNKVWVIDSSLEIKSFPLKPKMEVAADLFKIVLERWEKDEQVRH